jgi:hypothetical protein
MRPAFSKNDPARIEVGAKRVPGTQFARERRQMQGRRVNNRALNAVSDEEKR